MLREIRDKHAACKLLRHLVETAQCKSLRLTTDKHPAYRKAIRWNAGRPVLHRTDRCLNNRTKQCHRRLKQRYYPVLGFGSFESASCFYTAFDELRNYLKSDQQLTSAERRQTFNQRWSALVGQGRILLGVPGLTIQVQIGHFKPSVTAIPALAHLIQTIIGQGSYRRYD